MAASTSWHTNKNSDETLSRVLQSRIGNTFRLDIAVSYVVLSGWELLSDSISSLGAGNVRLLLTDQLLITQPAALTRALQAGVSIRNYSGEFYHPKTYLGFDRKERPQWALVGSANISEAGLTRSIEGGLLTSDKAVLSDMEMWFDSLFEDDSQTELVDEDFVERLSGDWAQAAAARLMLSLTRRQRKRRPSRPRSTDSLESVESLEDTLASINDTVSTLGLDQAGNNIRNLERALGVLRRYPNLSSKEWSELGLLGFVKDGSLSELGSIGRTARSDFALARCWCRWLLSKSNKELEEINPRLVSFRRAAANFWQLQPEVRKFFLRNLSSERERDVLQAVELLCNGSPLASRLSLDEIRIVAPRLLSAPRVSSFVAKRISEYTANKGARSWSSHDRRTILLAWRSESARTRKDGDIATKNGARTVDGN